MTTALIPNGAFLNAELDFGLSMLRQVPVTQQLVVSPISVIFALAMVQAGARGKTKMQIDQAISRGAADGAVVDYYSKLSRAIMTSNNGTQARIANGFFIDKRFNISNEYANTVSSMYSAKIESLDFTQPEQAAKTIENFVSQVTSGKLQNIANADTVKDAFAVLINAIYFNAEWEYKFLKGSSSNRTFNTTNNTGRLIEFVNESDEERLYAEDQDMQLLSLRYKDPSYALNIFLPKNRFAIEQLREKLDGAYIQHMFSQLNMTSLRISIPKIKIETDFRLEEALMAMNVSEMFNDSADLTGITDSLRLKVSSATHKAIIEVDEDGTTAAAVTLFKLIPRFAPPESISIPKIKIETDFRLEEALMAMNVSEMFNDSADLTGITDSLRLKVSSATHKAIIEEQIYTTLPSRYNDSCKRR
ncbi:serine proteinase inhibitor [Ancylostoma ceylanicum]|uniref:Serine proteinase inhibitor n=1 Tax=Ancylostoma ceylanicum TaxID=53326 RepID=A0A0D6LML6_9BILA|nr:serine proteinase inhibitor [Ancylostoma ceylanicum]